MGRKRLIAPVEEILRVRSRRWEPPGRQEERLGRISQSGDRLRIAGIEVGDRPHHEQPGAIELRLEVRHQRPTIVMDVPIPVDYCQTPLGPDREMLTDDVSGAVGLERIGGDIVRTSNRGPVHRLRTAQHSNPSRGLESCID